MFGMFERPVKAEEAKQGQESIPAANWDGETKDPKINPDGSVGASAELAPLVASYEADRKAAAARERESAIGEPVMSSAIGGEHIRMGAAVSEASEEDDLALKQAEQQMQMSMQAFFEASKAKAAAEAEEKGATDPAQL